MSAVGRRVPSRDHEGDPAEARPAGPCREGLRELDGDLVVEAAHYLANRLHVLLATTELLVERRSQLDPVGAEALDLLTADVHESRRVVLELLELARPDSGGAVVGRVEALLDTVRRELVRRGDRAQVTTAPEVGRSAPAVDARLVARVLDNLLDNAVQHGCGVTGVTLGRTDDHVWFAVEDAGRGAPPRLAADPGAAPEPGAGTFAGHGVGLALARTHARRAGGDLTSSATTGGGACFTATFPLHPTAAA